MTLVAALDCGDSLLVGADGLVTIEGSDMRIRKRKLWTRDDPPLAMGFTGGEDVGYRFRDWFLSAPVPATWNEFADKAGGKLAEFNGARIHRAACIGVKATSADLAAVLLAGSVGGALEIWDLGCKGDVTRVMDCSLGTTGKGGEYAFAAYAAIKKIGRTDDLETMAICMEVAAEHAPMCGKPISLCRITKDQLIPMMQDANGKWSEEG